MNMSSNLESLSLDECLAIVRYWQMPFFLKKENGSLLPEFLRLSSPDPIIDQLLSDNSRLQSNCQFVVRFRLICNLAKKLSTRPSKDEIERFYATRSKKLSKLVDELFMEISSYSLFERSYISDILQVQVDNYTEAAGVERIEDLFPEFCRLVTEIHALFSVHKRAINNMNDHGCSKKVKKKSLEDWGASAEAYFKKFKGGHGIVNSRRAGVCALAKTYLLSFGEMPTSSPKSLFFEAASLFYEFMGSSAEFDSLCKDVKNAVKELKKSLKTIG